MGLDNLREIVYYLHSQAAGRSPENDEAGCLIGTADYLINELVSMEPDAYKYLEQWLSTNKKADE